MRRKEKRGQAGTAAEQYKHMPMHARTHVHVYAHACPDACTVQAKKGMAGFIFYRLNDGMD